MAGFAPGVVSADVVRAAGPAKKFFTAPLLILGALIGAGWAATSHLREPAPAPTYAFEVRLASTAGGFVQLFYDRGTGLNESDSALIGFEAGGPPQVHRLPLPPARLAALRLDPLNAAGVITLAEPPRIIGPGGRVVRTVAYSELQPAAQIAALCERGGVLTITTTPGACDPQLNIALGSPLDLRPDRTPFQAGLLLRTLLFLAPWAMLLFALDRMPPFPGEPRRGRLLRFLRRPPLAFTLLACGAILAARRPESLLNPQFWGEDSVIFYQGALQHGGRAIFEPYAGYLHLVPRLVATASAGFDPRWAPMLFALAALGGSLYVAARTQSERCPLPRHVGCALAVVLVPDGYEVLLNVVNLHWFLAGGAVLLLISADPTNGRQRIHDALAAVVLGLTGPFVLMLSGLFLWRAWSRRTRASLALATLTTACAVVQAWVIWRSSLGTPGGSIAYSGLLAVPGMRITGSLLTGFLAPNDWPIALEMALGLVTLAGLAVLAWRGGPQLHERSWMALAALAFLGASLWRCRFVLPSLADPVFGARYFYPIVMIVVWLLLWAATDARRWAARAATIVALWALLINVPRLREPAFPDLLWEAYAARIRAGEAVDVPVNPEPWVMRLPARPR